MDWRVCSLFAPLKAKHGVDALAPFTKVVGVYEELKKADGWVNYKTMGPMKPIKDEILDSYNA